MKLSARTLALVISLYVYLPKTSDFVAGFLQFY